MGACNWSKKLFIKDSFNEDIVGSGSWIVTSVYVPGKEKNR